MNRKQRNTLIVGAVLVIAAVVCPPWSYYGGQLRLWPRPDAQPAEHPSTRPEPGENAVPFRLQHDIGLVHGIRGLVILAILVVAATLYLKFASPATDDTERPGRPTRVFWIVFAVVAMSVLAIALSVLLVFLIRAARG